MLIISVVHALNKLPYTMLDSKTVGVREGVIFLTYSSLIASSGKGQRSRLNQLVQWCGLDFDGLIVFDEVPCYPLIKMMCKTSILVQLQFLCMHNCYT